MTDANDNIRYLKRHAPYEPMLPCDIEEAERTAFEARLLAASRGAYIVAITALICAAVIWWLA